MDSLDTYIESIKHFGRITHDREKKLSSIIRRSRNPQNVERAKEELINSNLFLVVDRALKLKNKYNYVPINIMDLISEGNIALMKAAKMYRGDHKSKAVFSTFAVISIDQQILKAIRTDRMIYLPTGYLKSRIGFYMLKDKYKDNLTDEIVMKELNISKDTMSALKDDKNQHVISLEEAFRDNEENSYWNDVLEDTQAVLPSEKIISESLSEYLHKYINRLNYREQVVIRGRHLSDSVATYDELGYELNISKERVRQIDYSALRKLKKFIATDWKAKHGEPEESTEGFYRFYTQEEIDEKDRKRKKAIRKSFEHLLTGV
jgi:RNA polymerase primary sigma factor